MVLEYVAGIIEAAPILAKMVIIADITKPKSSPLELQATVPEIMVARGVLELPPAADVSYLGFADPSGSR